MAACGAAHCAAAVCGVQNSQQGTQVSTNDGSSNFLVMRLAEHDACDSPHLQQMCTM